MRIPWTRLALVAAVSLSAASATAVTNFSAANTATRLIGLLGEDSGCTNTVTPGVPPHAADAGCFVHASDIGPPAAVYTDPGNDYYGTITWLGPNVQTGGTNTFQVTVSQPNWAKILAVAFTASGATLTGNTTFSFLFDADNQKVKAGNTCADPGSPGPNPCFYQATATFAGNGIFLTGLPDERDYPYYGNSSTLGGSQFSGPPLTFSCAWSAGLVVPAPLVVPLSALGPAGYLTTPIPIPSPPCGVPAGVGGLATQQGFELGGSLPGTSIDFFQISTIELAAAPGTAYADAVYTDYKFWLTELGDTDGDGVPDYPNAPLGTVTKTLFDNCPFKPNGPALGTCQGPAVQANCHVNLDCGVGHTCSLNQEDTGGIGSGSAADFIGDSCQCGDSDNNGIVNNNDATFVKRAVAGLAPYVGGVTTLQGYHKCDVQSPTPAPGDTCNNNQATFIARAVANLAPGIHQTCHAATVFP